MEAQKAGDVWEPRLKAIARNVLRRKLTDGDIDQLLAPESVTYEFLAKAAADPDASPSALKAIFSEASGGDAILATWLVDVSRDAEITGKGAAGELTRLVESRLGLSLPDGVGTAKARAAVLRYVLGGEFRSDLGAPAPASLDAVPAPKTKDAETSVREMAGRLRASYPSLYPAIANQVELELGLADAQIPGPALGSIDTFRFEERVVFEYTADLISTGAYDEALRHVAERAGSFWLAQDLVRTAQWEASKRMAELGRVATAILAEIGSVGGSSADWVRRYTEADGWLELDRVQRRMETWIGKLDDEPPERSVGVVRRAYETACQAMAKGFTKVLESGGWTVPGVLQRRRCSARWSPNSQSPWRTSSSTPCGTRWAPSSWAACPRAPRSGSGRPSPRCRRSRPLAWPRCSQMLRALSRWWPRTASSALGSRMPSCRTSLLGGSSPRLGFPRSRT
jgi:hypothetical protein